MFLIGVGVLSSFQCWLGDWKGAFWSSFVSDIAIFVLKRDVKLHLTN